MFFNNKIGDLCKGVGDFANKRLSIESLHLFGMDLTFIKDYFKLGGFHHDYQGVLQKSGLYKLKNIKEYKDGFYKAQLIIKDKKVVPPKTFFPQHWTQEKVIESIADAYNNIKNITFEKSGKYDIKGITKEGVTIQMHVTQKGRITSAYPIFK